MRYYILIACFAFLCGCASEPRGVEPQQPRYVHNVRFESDPPGMRVYFGSGGEVGIAEHAEAFVGLTPCEKKIKCDADGNFEIDGIKFYNKFRQPVAVFLAEPPFGQTNLFRQELSYRGHAKFQSPDKVPDAVFFDMHKKP